MRVIMGYMYKDHLKAKLFCLLPFTSNPEPSVIHIQAVLSTICIQTVSSTSSSNQLPKRIKKKQRKERKWNYFSSLDKRLLLHFFNF